MIVSINRKIVVDDPAAFCAEERCFNHNPKYQVTVEEHGMRFYFLVCEEHMKKLEKKLKEVPS